MYGRRYFVYGKYMLILTVYGGDIASCWLGPINRTGLCGDNVPPPTTDPQNVNNDQAFP